MHPEALPLSLVPVPELDLAERVFVAASRCAGTALAAPPPACGPGWFDSSWDLRRGLVVTEADDDGLLAWSLRMLQGQADTDRQRPRSSAFLTAAPRSITASA